MTRMTDFSGFIGVQKIRALSACSRSVWLYVPKIHVPVFFFFLMSFEIVFTRFMRFRFRSTKPFVPVQGLSVFDIWNYLRNIAYAQINSGLLADVYWPRVPFISARRYSRDATGQYSIGLLDRILGRLGTTSTGFQPVSFRGGSTTRWSAALVALPPTGSCSLVTYYLAPVSQSPRFNHGTLLNLAGYCVRSGKPIRRGSGTSRSSGAD